MMTQPTLTPTSRRGGNSRGASHDPRRRPVKDSESPARRGKAAAAPDDAPALPEDVAGLVELVALRLRRAGILVAPPRSGLSPLTAVSLAVESPLNGALSDEEGALCRMALREASLRLTAWPRMEEARARLTRAYIWLGGDPAAM